MLLLYDILLMTGGLLALPVLLPLILTTEKRRRTVPGRLGLGSDLPAPGPGEKRIWVHALSVGEVLASAPLVAALRRRHPREAIVFTASTFTGLEIARERIAPHVDGVGLFPFDLILPVRRVADRVAPKMVVMVETDLWPNFLYEMDRRGVPVMLVNGRLSDRSFGGYKRFSSIFKPLFSRFARVCAQSAEDARRFRKMGTPPGRVAVTGNLKFDQPRPDASPAALDELQRSMGISPHRRVWVAGSTHPGEEAILAEALRMLRRDCPDLFCIAAPRDPNRAGETASVFREKGFSFRLLSAGPGGADGVVIDAMGLLARLYGLADAAFVGGSLIPFGGHNPLEPAALSRPVIFGPHMHAFREISERLLAAGGAVRAADAPSLAKAVGRLLADPARAARIGEKGRAVFEAHRGAVDRTLSVIDAVCREGTTR